MKLLRGLLIFFMVCLVIACQADSISEVKVTCLTIKLNEGTERVSTQSNDEICTYLVSVSEVEMNSEGEWQVLMDSPNNRSNLAFSGSLDELAINNISPGNYAMAVEAKDFENRVIMNGAPEDVFTVTSDGEACINVILQPVDSGPTGSAEITFDWLGISQTSDAVATAMKGNGLVFELSYFKDSEDEWVSAGKSEPTYGGTSLKFIVEGLPVSTGLNLMYSCSMAESGIALSNELYTDIIPVYSGLNSKIEADGGGGYSLQDSDTGDIANVKNVEIGYPDNNAGTSLTVSWENEMAGSESIFDFVEVLLTPVESGNPIFRKVDVSGDKSTIEIDNLSENTFYTLSVRAHHRDGYYSSYLDYGEKVSGKIWVEKIKISTKNVPDDIHRGTSFDLSVNFTPSDATFRGIEWIISDPEVISHEGDTFTALKKGTATITAVSTDDSSKTSSVSITVGIPSPENVCTSLSANSIDVSWNHSEDAQIYEVYRSNNDKSYELIGEATDTAYSDTCIATGRTYYYKVKALCGEYSSVLSSASDGTKVAENYTKIEKSGSSLVSDDSSFVILPDDEEGFTLSASSLTEAESYSWYINDKIAKSGTYDDGSSFITVTRNSIGIENTVMEGSNTLRLVLCIGGSEYIYETSFDCVDTLATGVNLTPYENVSRLSTVESDGSKRQVQLTADVLPYNSTFKTVKYKSSDESIATVSEDGIVALTGGFGKVTITAEPKYYDDESAIGSVILDVYEPKISDFEQLLSAVNSEMKKHIDSADSQFGGDWWPMSSTGATYSSDGITITSSHKTIQTCGSIEFSNYSFSDSSLGGEIIINGSVSIKAKAASGLLGYSGDNALKYVGYESDSRTLTVTLPGNQGNAEICYYGTGNGIDVLNISTSDYYTVEYLSSIGTDCYGEDSGAFRGGMGTVYNNSSLSPSVS